MRTVTAMQLRAKLGQILDAASSGERIVIERDHRPVAVLVSFEDAGRLVDQEEERLRQIDEAFAGLAEFGRRMAVKYPRMPGDPDPATAVRMDRDRDLIDE
jgi:prevent-host-death family protein